MQLGGGPAHAALVDFDGDGYLNDVDCDDQNVDVYPGAPDHCDMQDNDCDGQLELDELTDSDADGYPLCADCADFEPTIHPFAPELCNGEDDDCDGALSPGEDVDVDMDGFLLCEDCDDALASVHPFAPEVCDGLDSDCDGFWPLSEITDIDGDLAIDCMDCDDMDEFMSPFYGTWELCDGKDNNCDGSIEFEHDLDGDGRMECNGDCDDDEASVFGDNPETVEPDAHPEWCDSLDNNCDYLVDEFFDFDVVPTIDEEYGLTQNASGLSTLVTSGSANAQAAMDASGSHRGWGVLELLHEDDSEPSALDGPAGVALQRFGIAVPGSHTMAGSYCVDFDFRVPTQWSDTEETPASVSGDGFTVMFFDRALVGTGNVSDADWATDGAYGGGYLGAVGLDGTRGQAAGWAVEFDMYTNGVSDNTTTMDPNDWEAHLGLSFVSAGEQLVSQGRLLPYTVNDTGTAGTTDLAAPPGAVATADFDLYGPSQWDPGVRDAGWHHAMIGWNPQMCPAGVSPTKCQEPDRDFEGGIAVWLSEEGNFNQFDQPLVPPSGLNTMPVSNYDGSWSSREMIIGLSAGKNIARSTFEVDNLRLVCGPCPRFVGPGQVQQPPDGNWFDARAWSPPPPGSH